MRSDSVYSGNRAGGSALRHAAALLAAAFWLLLSSGLAKGADINVDCSKPNAKVKTITAALAQLDKRVENTIRVSGTCTEWVRIGNFENLTLTANKEASISAPTTPPPEGYPDLLFVYGSGTVIVKGFTINGREIDEACVACTQTRYCSLENNAIQGAQTGVGASSNTNLYLVDDTIQDNTDAGVAIGREVSATLFGNTIQQNGYGVVANHASTLTFSPGAAGVPTTIQDNTYDGVAADLNSTVVLWPGSAKISSNGEAAGISLWGGSVLRVGQNNEIAGGLSAVVIGHLSLATFASPNILTGSGLVVVCEGKYSVAAGAGLVGITTNCTP